MKSMENKCFFGFCFNCGGQAEVGTNDDFHHFIHKSQGAKDEMDYLWPCLRACHEAMHANPILEKKMFREIEKTGYKVIWKAKTKEVNTGAA
jgi:5-methylcytosine-specific restriction endonuclease McrA